MSRDIDKNNSHIKEKTEEIDLIEKNNIWSECIIGDQNVPVADLISHLGNSDWVKSGMKYIDDSCKCPFCQQKTITENLKEQFEQFFDMKYEESLRTITTYKGNYHELTLQILEELDKILLNDLFFSVSEVDKDNFKVLVEAVQSNFIANENLIEKKHKQPSQSVSLIQVNIESICEIISTGNKAIQKHNDMVDNYTEERKQLIDDIWTYLLDEQEALIDGYLNDFKKYEKAKNGIAEAIESHKKEMLEVEDKINELNKNMTSVQPTVDEINRLLKAYGFCNFKIASSPTKKNSYQIQRPNGTLAHDTLSEGEETFISFLYFFQLTKGATDVSKVSTEKILIIDDPICVCQV